MEQQPVNDAVTLDRERAYLIGIAYRKPLMHDGCAQDLHARFDPSCGGAQHGKTSELSEAEIADLIAYLETL